MPKNSYLTYTPWSEGNFGADNMLEMLLKQQMAAKPPDLDAEIVDNIKTDETMRKHENEQKFEDLASQIAPDADVDTMLDAYANAYLQTNQPGSATALLNARSNMDNRDWMNDYRMQQLSSLNDWREYQKNKPKGTVKGFRAITFYSPDGAEKETVDVNANPERAQELIEAGWTNAKPSSNANDELMKLLGEKPGPTPTPAPRLNTKAGKPEVPPGYKLQMNSKGEYRVVPK